MIRNMQSKFAAALFSLPLALAASGAHAFEFEGSAVGNWTNVYGPNSAVYTITNNDAGNKATVEWGSPAPGYTSNFFMFDGVGSDPGESLFSVEAEELFQVGSFWYRNGATYSGTNISGVDLGIDLSIVNPLNTSETFSYNYAITSTPNTGNAQQNADYVTLGNGLAPDLFSFNGVDYSLELVGFSSDGGVTLVDSFHVLEGATSDAAIYARITAVGGEPNTDVPNPATLALLGLGLVGLRRFKRS